MESVMAAAAQGAANADSVSGVSVQQMPLSVKGAQVAIGRQAAAHIITTAGA